jgi:AcrR family transcriptional regulator
MTGATDRQEKIIAAAYELLEEEGLEGLTIRAVLTRTGLARRAFYERFAGKDELVLAVFEQTIRTAADLYAGQCRRLPDPVERLRLIVSCIVLGTESLEEQGSRHGQRRSAALSREHLRLAESHTEALQQALRPLIDLIAAQLAEGIAAGLVRAHDPQRLAWLVYNLVSTTVHIELLTEQAGEPDAPRRDALAVEIWDFCRRAIAAG